MADSIQKEGMGPGVVQGELLDGTAQFRPMDVDPWRGVLGAVNLEPPRAGPLGGQNTAKSPGFF